MINDYADSLIGDTLQSPINLGWIHTKREKRLPVIASFKTRVNARSERASDSFVCLSQRASNRWCLSAASQDVLSLEHRGLQWTKSGTRRNVHLLLDWKEMSCEALASFSSSEVILTPLSAVCPGVCAAAAFYLNRIFHFSVKVRRWALSEYMGRVMLRKRENGLFVEVVTTDNLG